MYMTKGKKNKEKTPKRKRFKEFFITLNPALNLKVDREMDWTQLSDEECSQKCEELITTETGKFPTFAEFQYSLEALADGVCRDCNKNGVHFAYKMSSERGSENGKPHYHAVAFGNKITTKVQIVKFLSGLLFGEINSEQIDVQPVKNYEAATTYVAKNPWQVAGSEFAIGTWNSKDEERVKFMKERPHIKKLRMSLETGKSF